jgi:4-amino-4-deoxy-L-arabinose transferase-like glycosyltransferase
MKNSEYWRWIFEQPQKSNSKTEIIVDRHDSAKRGGYALALLILLAGLLFFFGADKIALVGPDEPRYSEVAREIFVSRDYISTTLCGCLWFEKPALFYWLAAISYRLFGVNEFAARFPSGVAALVAVLTVYFTLWRSGFVRWARLASLALITSGIFIAYSHAATPDMALTAAMTIAILSGYLATRADGKAEIGWMMLCGAAVGLGMLAKGLAAIVLVTAILFLWLLISGRLRFLRWRYFLLWLLPFFAVTATWYLPVTLRYGYTFIDEFFIKHHFQRYLTNVYGHPQPVYFYLVIAILGVAPWTFFLLLAAARLRRLQPRRNEGDAILTLAWVWVIVPLLFFSLSGSKLPGYLLPVFPALAILLGAEMERWLDGVQERLLKVSVWLTALLLLALGIGFIIYLQRQQVAFGKWSILFYLLPAAFAILAGGFLLRKSTAAFLYSASALVLSIVIGGVLLLFPTLNDEISLKALSLQAAAALRPDEKIGYYILKEFAAVFYAEGRVVCGMGEGDVLNALREDKLVEPLQQYPSLIFITRERWIEGLMNDGRFTVEFIAQQGDYYAFRVQLKNR